HRLLAAKARESAAERAADFAERRLRDHPSPIRQLMAEPGRLPLAVAARVALGCFYRRSQIDLALEMPDQPWPAVRFHRRTHPLPTPPPQRAGFVARAPPPHRLP